MTQSARRLAGPYLAVVVAGLCALNWWQANTPIDVSPIMPELVGEAAPTGAKPVAPDAGLNSLSDFSETVTRPVFRSDRHQPAAKSTVPAATVNQEPAVPFANADTLRLVGMMRSGSSAQRALIRVAGMPNAAWVEVGGEVGGWTVGKIETDRVLIERNGDKAELRLFAPKPAAAAPAP